MQLLIARHGETDWLVQYRYQGSTDVTLNEKGKRQTQLLVQALAAYKPKIVYSSHLSRTRVAAEALAKAAGIPHKIDKRIAERHFGVWEGLEWGQIKTRYPDQVKDYRTGRPDFAPEGGENLLQVQARWKAFLKDILSQHRDDTVSIITHGGLIRVALLNILKASPDSFHLIQQDPAAINIAKGDESFMRICLINSGAHLIQDGVSWAS